MKATAPREGQCPAAVVASVQPGGLSRGGGEAVVGVGAGAGGSCRGDDRLD